MRDVRIGFISVLSSDTEVTLKDRRTGKEVTFPLRLAGDIGLTVLWSYAEGYGDGISPAEARSIRELAGLERSK